MTVPLAVRPPQARPTRRRAGWGWPVAAAVALLPALIPPVSLLFQVLGDGSSVVIPTGRLLTLLASTVALTIAVTLTAVAIGLTTAWLTTRTDISYRRTWMTIAALPLVVPSYVAAHSLIAATGPDGVLLELPTPYGFVGAWLVLAIFTAPLVHLTVIPGLRGIDPATEEAASGLGAERWKVFRTVTLPQLRPAILSASLLVGLYTIADFGAVSLLRYDTFTRAIYTLYRGQIDRRPSATLSLVLMVLALLIVVVERSSRGRAQLYSKRPTRIRSPHRLVGWKRPLSVSFLGAYAFLALGIPVIVMTLTLVRGIGLGQALGATLWTEAGRTLLVALVAGVITAVAALPVAVVVIRRPGRFSAWVESVVWGTYSLPHITVGVAAVGFALQWARPLYQTIVFLVLIYVAVFLPQAVGSVQESLRRTSPDLEDASRGLGRGPLRTLLRITLPLALPGLLAGASLAFLSVMKELPATLLLRPNGFETLAIRVWSSTAEGFLTRASAAGLLLLLVSIVPLFLVMSRDLSD